MYAEDLDQERGLQEVGESTCQKFSLDADSPLVVVSRELVESLHNDPSAETSERDAIYNREGAACETLGLIGICFTEKHSSIFDDEPIELLRNAIEHGIAFGERGTLEVSIYRSKTSDKVFLVLEQPTTDFEISNIQAIARDAKREINDAVERGIFLNGAVNKGVGDPHCQFGYERDLAAGKLRTLILLEGVDK